MNIAGLTFKPVTAPIDGGHPTIFLYKHLASGKCYPMSRMRPSKYIAGHATPRIFKDFVNKEPSDTRLLFCEIPNADPVDLRRIISKVTDQLYSSNKLIYRQLLRTETGIPAEPQFKHKFHICTAVHTDTGAHYVFVVNQAANEIDTFAAKLKTHNGYVQKQIRHVNRTMHEFARKHKPLHIGRWEITKDIAEYDCEDMANRIAVKFSKDFMLQGKIVLNRVSGADALYYRNNVLRLANVNIESYLAA